MSLMAKIQAGSQKKILALDGGGIRGILTVEILARIEELLRQKSGRGEVFKNASRVCLKSSFSRRRVYR
jgi:patatin-like phospholipase/acyl hydrolase